MAGSPRPVSLKSDISLGCCRSDLIKRLQSLQRDIHIVALLIEVMQYLLKGEVVKRRLVRDIPYVRAVGLHGERREDIRSLRMDAGSEK